MKDFEYYRGLNLEYPAKPKKPGLKSTAPSEEEISQYVEQKNKYEADLIDYESKKSIYNIESNKLHIEFWEDARKELGYSFGSVWDKICQKAWEDGHSYGYSEVYNHLGELCEFVDSILEVSK